MSTLHVRRVLAWVLLCLGFVQAETPRHKAAPALRPGEEALSKVLHGPETPAAGAVGTTGATAAPTAPFVPKTASSTSTSKQFIVYGGDLNLRSTFCVLCEETAAALGRVLKDNGDFVLPIIVVLKTPPDITTTGPAVTLNIGEL